MDIKHLRYFRGDRRNGTHDACCRTIGRAATPAQSADSRPRTAARHGALRRHARGIAAHRGREAASSRCPPASCGDGRPGAAHVAGRRHHRNRALRIHEFSGSAPLHAGSAGSPAFYPGHRSADDGTPRGAGRASRRQAALRLAARARPPSRKNLDSRFCCASRWSLPCPRDTPCSSAGPALLLICCPT